MTEKMPGGAWPPPTQNRIESKEGKRERIEADLREFFSVNHYEDKEGNPVTLEEVDWPTPEDEAAHDEIKSFIENGGLEAFYVKKGHSTEDYEQMKPMLSQIVGFLDEATTFDSMKTKTDHEVRRKIEDDLRTVSKKTLKYHDPYHAYYDNRLSLKHIRNPYTLMEVFFDAEDFTPETRKMYESGVTLLEEVVTEEDREHNEKSTKGQMHTKRYELLDKTGKLEATRETARFIISFFRDLERKSKEAKTEAK